MECPAHPDRRAVSACTVCGRPVCDLCLGQIDDVVFCPPHFEIAEARIRRGAYGLPPLPAPVTVVELLLGAWAVAGAVAPWLPWYRTVVFTAEGLRRVIDETGWEAGGLAALASIALLSSGVTLGVMVGIRAIRARLLAREAVARAALSLGATTLVVAGLRFVTRAGNLHAGAYVALTSAALVLYLGLRLSRSP